MNIDIVTSDRPEDQERLVNYGEPVPAAVYRAALGIEPGASADLNLISAIIEEIEDNYWELFSLEFGSEKQPASFWQCSDYICNHSAHELHVDYEYAIKYVRNEYYQASVKLASSEG